MDEEIVSSYFKIIYLFFLNDIKFRISYLSKLVVIFYSHQIEGIVELNIEIYEKTITIFVVLRSRILGIKSKLITDYLL